jgi:hypothetical protein
MTSSGSPPQELVRPLGDLAAWTEHFRRAQIPVLRETVDSLDALRANEDLTDANSIGELIGGDPLMTLKVLAYASEHRGRSVVTAPDTVIGALVTPGGVLEPRGKYFSFASDSRRQSEPTARIRALA